MPTYNLVNPNVITQGTNGTFEGGESTWGLSSANTNTQTLSRSSVKNGQALTLHCLSIARLIMNI